MNNILNIFSVIISIILLAVLLLFVYKQVEETFLQQDDVLTNLRNKCVKVFPEEMKNIRLYKGDKSYTINKEKIYLCMKDENDAYYKEDILMHVLLHEMAHTMCPEIGHTEMFQDIFRGLMDKASNEGIYDLETRIPENYCMF